MVLYPRLCGRSYPTAVYVSLNYRIELQPLTGGTLRRELRGIFSYYTCVINRPDDRMTEGLSCNLPQHDRNKCDSTQRDGELPYANNAFAGPRIMRCFQVLPNEWCLRQQVVGQRSEPTECT